MTAFTAKMLTATGALVNALRTQPNGVVRKAALSTAKKFAADAVYEADTEEQVEFATQVMDLAVDMEKADMAVKEGT